MVYNPKSKYWSAANSNVVDLTRRWADGIVPRALSKFSVINDTTTYDDKYLPAHAVIKEFSFAEHSTGVTNNNNANNTRGHPLSPESAVFAVEWY